MANQDIDPNAIIGDWEASDERYDENTESARSTTIIREMPFIGPIQFRLTQFTQKNGISLIVQLKCFPPRPRLCEYMSSCFRFNLSFMNVDSLLLYDTEKQVWQNAKNAYYMVSSTPRKLIVLNDNESVKILESSRVIGSFEQALCKEIHTKPEFGGPYGIDRFTLKSNDGDLFHVHSFVLSRWSEVLKECIDKNYDHIRDGQPYPVQCSTSVLLCLLHVIYLNQKITPFFTTQSVEIVKVAHMLEMTQILEFCTLHMQQTYKQQTQTFDQLMTWFLCAADYALSDGKLAQQILVQLVLLSKDEEKQAQVEAQVIEYWGQNPAPPLDNSLLFKMWTKANGNGSLNLNVLFLRKMGDIAKENEANKTLFQDLVKKYCQSNPHLAATAIFNLMLQI